MNNFTQKQQSLINNLASGMAVNAAMKASGYSNTTRASVAITPAMQAHLRQLMVEKLAAMAPAALVVLNDLMDDEDASPKIRLDAAKTILDRAGFVPPKASDAPTVGEKSLHEMSRDELAARVRQIQGEIAVASR
jgi:short-subunit dehydrogenase involved in D-alanine esterification of teichoic acids